MVKVKSILVVKEDEWLHLKEGAISLPATERLKLSGIEEGMIYTPYELTDQQIQDIEKAISQKENKKVTLKVSIDPSLLGGIKVQIANRIYDGTIKNKVEMLKKELLRK